MFGVELYARVRQLVFLQGVSRREVARQLGIAWAIQTRGTHWRTA
jgi:DNA-binding transcriptional regulator LsrR (DeoR family)